MMIEDELRKLNKPPTVLDFVQTRRLLFWLHKFSVSSQIMHSMTISKCFPNPIYAIHANISKKMWLQSLVFVYVTISIKKHSTDVLPLSFSLILVIHIVDGYISYWVIIHKSFQLHITRIDRPQNIDIT
jgi:hypothetical protein